MNINEAKKIMKKETTIERESAFYTLYGVRTQKEVLEQFKREVTALKVIPFENKRMKKEKVAEKVNAQYQEQYTKLLELILKYSHAIFFLYSKERINKNFSAYRKVAIESIKDDNVERAFKNFARLYNYKEPIATEEPKAIEEPIAIDNNCLALEHIEKLRKELESDLKVMGGSVEDKKAYIKFAIISLAIGAMAKDITDESYQMDPKASIYDFSYIETLVSELRAYQKDRKLSERGIRNGVDKLKLAMSEALYTKTGKKHSHCRNFNHLIHLYKECLTSSTPKA
ncbi:MAG: hypothetical protein KAU90_03580 [Sulfurovaceae bacterium]|nr:hypothetical protein [Sulfurovaceae bacterium]